MTSSRLRKWQFPRDDVPAWGVATVMIILFVCFVAFGAFMVYQQLTAQLPGFTGWQEIFFALTAFGLITSAIGGIMAARVAIARHKQRKSNDTSVM